MFEFIKSLFKTNESTLPENSPNMDIESISKYQKEFNVNDINTISQDDHLGLAANAKYCAELAMKDKDYEKAWSLFTEQKNQFIKSVKNRGYPASESQALEQIVALKALVHEDFANILRLKKNHKKALISMIYCVAGEYPTVKYKAKKLPAYFNRAKLKDTSFEELEDFIYALPKPPNYRTIQDKVKEWIED